MFGFRRKRSDDQKYVSVLQAMVKWGVNMVVFSFYFMVPETSADKKIPFFELGSCSWGTYWQFRLGRFLFRFLQVIFTLCRVFSGLYRLANPKKDKSVRF